MPTLLPPVTQVANIPIAVARFDRRKPADNQFESRRPAHGLTKTVDTLSQGKNREGRPLTENEIAGD